jgi:nicotinamide mononucleotide adenylyltransferase
LSIAVTFCSNVYVSLHQTDKFSSFFLSLELARDELRSKGFHVLGGYMSPVNDAYKKKGLLSAEHRLEMCNVSCQSSDFVMVDPWEASQSNYQRTLTVLSRVKTFLTTNRHVPEESLKVMLLCGSDLLLSFCTPGVWIPEQVNQGSIVI